MAPLCYALAVAPSATIAAQLAIIAKLRTDFEGQRISCELVDDSFLTMEGDAPVVDAALESIMTCDPSQCRLLRLL